MLTAYRRANDQRTTAAGVDADFAVATRPSRKDALPEHTHYIDSGCDLHPSCLSCPLVRCRYDEPGGARRLFSDERDRRIVRLQREEQLSIDLLAQRFGVSRRTVFRVLARERMTATENDSRARRVRMQEGSL
jgi:hypothetical protein